MKSDKGILNILPDGIRMSIQSAWRGRERGLAVFAGVLLASLVITTVLSYGGGLSQVFFQEALENDPIDAKFDLRDRPDSNSEITTNNTTILTENCAEFEAMEEISDCALVFGRQAIRVSGFFDESFVIPQPLNVEYAEASTGNWENVSWNYLEQENGGPPINDQRTIRFYGDGMWDGEHRTRHAEQLLYGEWPESAQEAVDKRTIILPSRVAFDAEITNGSVIDRLDVSYIAQGTDGDPVNEDECNGVVEFELNGYEFCREIITLENLTVVGIYEEFEFGNPTLLFNPVIIPAGLLNETLNETLMNSDHGYLAIALDRGALPTSSTADAREYLTDLYRDIESKEFGDQNLEFVTTDMISGTITFLNIFLGLIQIFDAIIMIPIIILSLSVLVYGLTLSLEQRRREVAIHRVIGGTSQRLQRMVLAEILFMATTAWAIGYLLAMLVVPIVLSAVGFMDFRTGSFQVNPWLSLGLTFVVALTTVGLALIFASSQTKEFLSSDIEDGVKNNVVKRKPRTWLHLIMFFIGILSFVDAFLETQNGDQGLIKGFLLNAVIAIFGPFLLWIGGALVLSRIGALGPRILKVIFGRTPVLKDIRTGLSGSSSGDSIQRLAVIMILTLSIVTLAAVQGYTGTLVDERTASVNAGADFKVTFNEPVNESTALEIVREYVDQLDYEVSQDDVSATSIQRLLTFDNERDIPVLVWALLDGHEEVLHWDDQAIPGSIDDLSSSLENGSFLVGSSIGYSLGLGDDIDEEMTNNKRDLISEGNQLLIEKRDFVIAESDDSEPLPEYMADLSMDQLQTLLGVQSFLLTGPDLSGLDLSGQDMSGRDLGQANFLQTNLAGTNFAGANLSGALFAFNDATNASFVGADLSGAIIIDNAEAGLAPFPSFAGANFAFSNLADAWGVFNLSANDMTNATCSDGSIAIDSVCESGPSTIPQEVLFFLGGAPSASDFTYTTNQTTITHVGQHVWIPGMSANEAATVVVIGESSWAALVGENYSTDVKNEEWFFEILDESVEAGGDALRELKIIVSSDEKVSEVTDWSTQHRSVERDGGLIFGTPGLLSLQFVVASLASVASAFVFLTLVLNQRKKELAILQAIGASNGQVIRLVLFEILSIILVSMVLGIMLGIGISQAFNGFFNIFGFIFQFFGGSATPIARNLVYPWTDLIQVNGFVISAVVIALFLTTRNALKGDLSMILKGE